MRYFKENKFLNSLCHEYNIKLPDHLKTLETYKEIENFRDAEFIYCIAYEMLIRTSEYNNLLEKYRRFKKMITPPLVRKKLTYFHNLIKNMENLGLTAKSFIGYPFFNDQFNVFQLIQMYENFKKNPWHIKLKDYKLNPRFGYDNIDTMIIDFYYEQNNLFIMDSDKYILLDDSRLRGLFPLDINYDSSPKLKQDKPLNRVHPFLLNQRLNVLFLPIKVNNKIEYKTIHNITYLDELNKDFLSLLEGDGNILFNSKLSYSAINRFSWYDYKINDISNGFRKLIKHYAKENLIFNSTGNRERIVDNQQENKEEKDQKNKEEANSLNNEKKITFNCVEKNPSSYYIPLYSNEILLALNERNKEEYDQKYELIKEQIENNGYKVIKIHERDYVHDIKYLVQLNEYLPLSMMLDSFLVKLKYQDIKFSYIDTEPQFNRPRLMFEEARLTKIPINLNLSKEDILLYVGQIKDEYNATTEPITTSLEEYFFNIPTEDKFKELPKNIKRVEEKSTTKRLLPNKREEFKEKITFSFYIYDLYKLFIPYLQEKNKSINNDNDTEIKAIKDSRGINQIDYEKIEEVKNNNKLKKMDYTKDNLRYQIVDLFNEKLSQEQVEYYLTTMKEFIHGINEEAKSDSLKKQYNSKNNENLEPKYKNLIVGDSFIVKSNKANLINTLI